MDHYGASLELKTVDVKQRIISGYAAGHSNIDRVRDIIDPGATVKALARLGDVSKIGIFIGHNSSALPMGIALKATATPHGMYTETLIKPGVFGDDLLQTAQFLMEHGQPLGMSVGYRTRESKPERHEGKTIRRITDYDLLEWSYAANQTIANPNALVTGVKARRKAMSSASDGNALVPDDNKADDDTYHLETRSGRFHVVESDGTSLVDFATQVEATAALAALKADAAEDEGEDDDSMDKTTEPQGEVKAEWSTSQVNDLDDSAFLMISPGGQKDDGGKTVPRSLRQLPYKGPDGKIDRPHLRNAIARIPDLAGVSASEKASLQARARKMLEDANGGKTVDEADEWKAGAPLTIRGFAYRLLDISDTAAEEIKAMRLLGEDTRDNLRVRQEVREQLKAVGADIAELLTWSDLVEREQDGAAYNAHVRARLSLLTL